MNATAVSPTKPISVTSAALWMVPGATDCAMTSSGTKMMASTPTNAARPAYCALFERAECARLRNNQLVQHEAAEHEHPAGAEHGARDGQREAAREQPHLERREAEHRRQEVAVRAHDELGPRLHGQTGDRYLKVGLVYVAHIGGLAVDRRPPLWRPC